MDNPRLTYLFQVYFNKTASPTEREEFMELIASNENDEQLKSLLADSWQEFNGQNQVFNEGQYGEMLANILEKGNADSPAPLAVAYKKNTNWLRIAAAAAIFFIAASGTWFWLKNRQSEQVAIQSKVISDDDKQAIVPGGNKAVLTLANGTTIVLDSSLQGTLANQGNARVMKLNTATLAYNAEDIAAGETVYNTLSTPSGGQYQLILQDGTKVWLNASSSIYFPTVFKGKERNVTVTGEAYFEVAKNAAKPFKISVDDMKVQVLGTHFNIMAYGDESSINTTLLEGSVKISKGSSNKLLVPGQESRINKAGDIKIVAAEIEEVMAWKNGWFQFNGYDIEKVMRQISRWYNVDVVYEGKIPPGHFSGIVSRTNDISQVLKIIQAGGVRFKITGRKVTVFS
ncbi:MAG: FecR domain-containing protein [Ferruginibacter sp.]